jgi:hypothetical protein
VTVEQPSDDIVDRALQAMLDTPGLDRPPPGIEARLRRAIAGKSAALRPSEPRRPSRRDHVSWPSVALTLALLVAAGWGAAFHRRLLSDVAGQRVLADGSRYAFYTDGRVERVSGLVPPAREGAFP